MEHPNIEILQIAEKVVGNDGDDNEMSKINNDKQLNKVSILKGIQIRLQQNESLKKLEIRYFALSR